MRTKREPRIKGSARTFGARLEFISHANPLKPRQAPMPVKPYREPAAVEVNRLDSSHERHALDGQHRHADREPQ
ncbi:hypothetical protein Thi970DRAFT_03401 [Thiorhodovibrio frisius]|uniref:Uncharacterized protein n=1 Tax=Thiorhodovibrio frisius TaxID=631362 RepID=H8Z783_9GAMM|nr:hypothetical protein Thi970DRAFT_03401 [Thiorhodovibrio frisius]WPL20225.1 hypothetical protein Thiofri_00299 [Thiorhodovibrio frisius]